MTRSDHRLSLLGLGCMLLGGPLLAGCPQTPPAPPPAEVRIVPPVSREVRGQLLNGAMTVLGRLEQYDEASAFAQVFDRLNQWIHADPVGDEAASRDWRIDPLAETLPEPLRKLCDPEQLGSAVFDARRDVMALRDCRWLADIAKSARGEAVDDVDIAVALFRWTIRSLAIESDPPLAADRSAAGDRWFGRGEILLAGRGSPAQRSWIFLELLRQAGLKGVMLATIDAGGGLRPWAPALISGGEAYLFEPTYGLPIPGPDGTGVATVREAAADPAILDRLDAEDRPYPLSADDMLSLGVLVCADPESLSRRMRLVEQNLLGGNAVRLAVDASAVATAAIAALPHAEDFASPALWQFPFEVRRRQRTGGAGIARAAARELAGMAVSFEQGRAAPGRRGRGRVIRPLYAGRLREFRGEFAGPEGAKKAYLMARPTAAVISDLAERAPEPQRDRVRRLYEQMKEDATYFLGLVTLAEGDYQTASDYLGRMTLEAAPDGRWAAAARLNLATAKLALGETAAAVALLRDDRSPQRFGSRLRAARAEQETAAGGQESAGSQLPTETSTGMIRSSRWQSRLVRSLSSGGVASIRAVSPLAPQDEQEDERRHSPEVRRGDREVRLRQHLHDAEYGAGNQARYLQYVPPFLYRQT